MLYRWGTMKFSLLWEQFGATSAKGQRLLMHCSPSSTLLSFISLSLIYIRCVGLCALCQKPVTRMLQWCPICGHGGHSSCLQQWFSSHLTCPSGCGHRCSMKCRVGRTGVGQEARGKEEVEVQSDKEGRCCTQSCPRRTKNQISSWAISRVGGK